MSVGSVHPHERTAPPLSLSMSTAAAADATDDKDPPLFEPLFRGIARDYKRRLPLYGSDVADGLNSQCLAATLFLFFACLAPAVGFGALFGAATGGAIGTMEMVSSTAMCGCIYALTSAQPLTIIGSTGPVLAFVATLVVLAKKMSLPFLPLYGESLHSTMYALYLYCFGCLLSTHLLNGVFACPSQLGRGFGLREFCWLGETVATTTLQLQCVGRL